jgi:hypothetical protein
VLEIKGENRFKPWRQDVEVEPNAIQKVHAMLIPASGGAPSGGALSGGAPSGKTPAHAEVADVPPPPPPHAASHLERPAPHAASHLEPPSPPPVAQEAMVPPAPHVARHKKPRDVAADDGADVTASNDDDSGAKPDTKPEKGGDCTMTVNSVPWSEVWIDGKNTTQHTPVVDYKIPCGKHKLAFKRSDMQIDHSESITVKPGQNFKQRYTLATDE